MTMSPQEFAQMESLTVDLTDGLKTSLNIWKDENSNLAQKFFKKAKHAVNDGLASDKALLKLTQMFDLQPELGKNDVLMAQIVEKLKENNSKAVEDFEPAVKEFTEWKAGLVSKTENFIKSVKGFGR